MSNVLGSVFLKLEFALFLSVFGCSLFAKDFGSSAKNNHGSSAKNNHGSSTKNNHGSSTKNNHGSSTKNNHGSSAKNNHGSSTKNSHGSSAKNNHGSSAKNNHGSSAKNNHGSSAKNNHGSSADVAQNKTVQNRVNSRNNAASRGKNLRISFELGVDMGASFSRVKAEVSEHTKELLSGLPKTSPGQSQAGGYKEHNEALKALNEAGDEIVDKLTKEFSQKGYLLGIFKHSVLYKTAQGLKEQDFEVNEMPAIFARDQDFVLKIVKMASEAYEKKVNQKEQTLEQWLNNDKSYQEFAIELAKQLGNLVMCLTGRSNSFEEEITDFRFSGNVIKSDILYKDLSLESVMGKSGTKKQFEDGSLLQKFSKAQKEASLATYESFSSSRLFCWHVPEETDLTNETKVISSSKSSTGADVGVFCGLTNRMDNGLVFGCCAREELSSDTAKIHTTGDCITVQRLVTTTVDPMVGFFITPAVMVFAKSSLCVTQYKVALNEDKKKETKFGVLLGGGARYYMKPHYFVEVSYMYGFQTDLPKISYNSNVESYTTISIKHSSQKLKLGFGAAFEP
jgi:hypothetical protein